MLRQMRVGKARYVKQCKPAIHKTFSPLIGPNDVVMLHEFTLFGGASVSFQALVDMLITQTKPY